MKKTLETLEAADQLLADLQPAVEESKQEVVQLRFEIKALIELCKLDTNATIQININRIADQVNDLIVQVEEENICS
jgi:predicted component of type VI protein secretion system